MYAESTPLPDQPLVGRRRRSRWCAELVLRGAAALETTTVRLPKFFSATCLAPEYVAEGLLRADGFTDVRWVEKGTGPSWADWLAHGELDFDYNFPPAHVRSIDAGAPITVLTGVHSGCLELIANDRIHDVTELKGKRVGVSALTSAPHLILMIMVAYVGVDPKDIYWVTSPDYNPVKFLAEGKIDAFLGFPTEPQETRARRLATRSSVLPSIPPGRSISAACFPAPWTTSQGTRWRPSA